MLPAGVVLTCGKDNCLRLVDARSFQVRKTLSAPGFMVATTSCTACLSPDETHAAAGSSNGTVFVWEVSLPALLDGPVVIVGALHEFAVALTVWTEHPTDDRCCCKVPGCAAWGLRISCTSKKLQCCLAGYLQYGHRIIAASLSQLVCPQIESGKAVRTLKDAGTQNVHVTAWSPLGRPLISLDKSGVMMRWQS